MRNVKESEWIDWEGGECPVDPDSAVRWRCYS